LEGATDGPDQAQRVARYADAGATWWIEALGWWRGDNNAAMSASSPEHQPNPTATAPGAPLAPNTRRAVRQASPELPRTLNAHRRR
jgi:hypothetical protein